MALLFHHQMKQLEVRQECSAARRIFNALLSVSSGEETLRLMLDILPELFTPHTKVYLEYQPRRRLEVSHPHLMPGEHREVYAFPNKKLTTDWINLWKAAVVFHMNCLYFRFLTNRVLFISWFYE